MRDGERIRLKGSAGALFMVTVGRPFTQEEIQRRLDSGEWSWPGDAPPSAPEPDTGQAPAAEPPAPVDAARQPEAAPDPERPAQSAPKSEWIAYVARTQRMSREDAANYTKADLIDMAS